MALTIQQSPVLTEMLPAHEEVDGSPTEGFDAQGFHATRRLKCLWQDRLTMASMLIGQTLGQTGNPGSQTIVVVLPHQYPHYPAASCRSVEIAPLIPKPTAADAQGRISQHEHAILTAAYRTPDAGEGDPQDSDTVIFTERLDPSVEFITVAANNLTWEPSGEPIDPVEAPGIPVRMLDYTLSVSGIASFDPAAVLQAGVCNSIAVLAKTINVTFPAETLLFHGFFPTRTWTTAGAQLWAGDYRFTYKPSGWNKFWRAGFATPQPIYANGVAFKPVPPVNVLSFLP